jgi:hypothetical protein
MRGTAVVRSQRQPLRIEPERGQGPKNLSGSTSSKEAWHVFQVDEPGSHLANHARDLGPQPSLVLGAELLPGDAPRLAGETGRDEIHATAPRATIEGREIVPDRSAIQGLVFHPRHEAGRGESVPLDVAHTSVGVSEGESDAELEPAASGT